MADQKTASHAATTLSKHGFMPPAERVSTKNRSFM
ncbi:hypothetical protein ABID26_006995 [Mesorhizobium shonense]|uniref:Uncharacterized protein n=1 Tax=Mesorhizobium shonense TaxID=1209948 RepID=A0ABV2I469_9HYPH